MPNATLHSTQIFLDSKAPYSFLYSLFPKVCSVVLPQVSWKELGHLLVDKHLGKH